MDNICNNLGIGGGVLFDIGCYIMLVGWYFFDVEFVCVVLFIDWDLVFGIDWMISVLFDFG